MEDKTQVIKGFREARKAGEKLLSEGRITWDDYAATMACFEAKLHIMGVNL